MSCAGTVILCIFCVCIFAMFLHVPFSSKVVDLNLGISLRNLPFLGWMVLGIELSKTPTLSLSYTPTEVGIAFLIFYVVFY